MKTCLVVLLIAMSANMVHASGVDIAGRPIFGAEGKLYYPDTSGTAAMRIGSRLSAIVAPRAPSLPQNIIPPTGYPIFSGDGSNFGFYDYMTYAVGSFPDAVAIADVNGDGRNDVILATTAFSDPANDYHIFVFLQDVDGSLMPPVKYAYPDTANTVGLVAAHLHNGIGSDIAVGTSSGISVFLSTPSGLATPVFYLGQRSTVLAVLDANLDGSRDIAAGTWSDNAIVYLNDGSAGFAATNPLPTHDAGYDSMRARDIDGDGLDDLLIATGADGPNVGINVHWQIGSTNGVPRSSVAQDITLSAPTTLVVPDSPMYADVGDINSDGKPDIVASHAANSPTHLWHLNGQGGHTFAAAQAYPSYDIPETVVVADINRDGRQDIVTLHGGWLKAGVYLQASDAGMRPEQLIPIPYASHYSATGLALGDINNDGCLDAVIADYNYGLVVLYGHDCSDEIFKSGFE